MTAAHDIPRPTSVYAGQPSVGQRIELIRQMLLGLGTEEHPGLPTLRSFVIPRLAPERSGYQLPPLRCGPSHPPETAMEFEDLQLNDVTSSPPAGLVHTGDRGLHLRRTRSSLWISWSRSRTALWAPS